MSRQICILLLVLLSGCSTMAYYGQAVHGQASLLLKRQSVSTLLKSPETTPELRARLETSHEVREFAARHLEIPDRGRYRSYVVTGRTAVVWNVVATPELSLTPLRWCYPIVGCVPYRGFFRQERALREASQLQRVGRVVHVGGVPAYSTLGWFKDPLLDTFIHWPAGDFGNLLFHELAHTRVWVSGDAAFNESLASFVGDAAVRQWLINRPEDLIRYTVGQTVENRFSQLLAGLRTRLESIYESGRDDSEKRQQRERVYADFRRCHAASRAYLGNGRYDQAVASRLNNAYLAARQTYDQYETAFAVLFVETGSEWSRFWSEVDQLAALPTQQRRNHLQDLMSRLDGVSGEQQVAHPGDHEYADEVECQTFSRHGSGREQSR